MKFRQLDFWFKTCMVTFLLVGWSLALVYTPSLAEKDATNWDEAGDRAEKITDGSLNTTTKITEFDPVYSAIDEVRPDLNEERKRELAKQIKINSVRYEVDELLVIAISKHESDGFKNVRSECSDEVRDDGTCVHHSNGNGREDSVGYMQISDDTFSQVMGYRLTPEQMLTRWKVTLEAGVKYLSEQIHKYGAYDGISAYNGGVPKTSNSEYVEKILLEYNILKEKYRHERN